MSHRHIRIFSEPTNAQERFSSFFVDSRCASAYRGTQFRATSTVRFHHLRRPYRRWHRGTGIFSASFFTPVVNSSIVGFNRSISSSRSCRRCAAQGARENDSSCARPALLHNPCLRRIPSFIATACNWFMMRVRICTSRCRCHSSWRRSRLSAPGTHIRGKRSSLSNVSSNRAASLQYLHIEKTQGRHELA